MDTVKWNKFFLRLCEEVATMSEDPSTKMACVIVRDGVILATGYNGHPRGVTHRIFKSGDQMKYMFYEHAERNAIYNAARTGTCLFGASLYVLGRPCADCARAIIQAGIEKVYIQGPNKMHPRWEVSCNVAAEMMLESGITIMEAIDDCKGFQILKPVSPDVV